MSLQLVRTILTSDELSRLCVFHRDDNFFQYRIDRLIVDDEEFGPYWREGYPLSGIFSGLEEAEIEGQKRLTEAA